MKIRLVINLLKKSNYSLVVFSALVFLTGKVAFAAPLTVTDFVADTPATAASVNSAFAQVESSVNDNNQNTSTNTTNITSNASTIMALQAQVDILQAAASATLLDNISGSTYKWVSMDVRLGDSADATLGAGANDLLSSQVVAFDDVITFNANGTVNETYNFREWVVSIQANTVTNQETLDTNVTENGISTWSLVGNTITFIGVTGTVSIDGNVIIVGSYANTNQSDASLNTTSREVTLGVLVKISN